MQEPREGIVSLANYLSELYPPCTEKANHVAKTIYSKLHYRLPLTLVHGDFHEKQILVSGKGVNACDFDNFCVGAPSSDLANLVGQLQYRECLGEIPTNVVNQIDDLSCQDVRDRYGKSAANNTNGTESLRCFDLVRIRFEMETAIGSYTLKRFCRQSRTKSPWLRRLLAFRNPKDQTRLRLKGIQIPEQIKMEEVLL